MQDRANIVHRIRTMAARMRIHALQMARAAGAHHAHIGGGFSIIDITATLYGGIMRLDPNDPQWPGRDRFILSKGHGVLGYYAALVEVGYIAEQEIDSFEQTGSDLIGHPVINRRKGIEFSNGSLGMGLSVGIGVALAGRRQGGSHRVYVLMGDGECNEGSVWEAAMAAPHYQLDNLVAIIDKNNYQLGGSNAEVMSVGDLTDKLRSFGWHALQVDGHDAGALYDALGTCPSGKPLAVVADTVKGKGLAFAENNNAFHHGMVTQSQYETALEELTWSLNQLT